jgi:histone-binding protein RBBP4
MSLPHENAVNSIQAMPKKSTTVVSRSLTEVYLWDFKKSKGKQPVPISICKMAGRGMRWSKSKEGQLLLGLDDGDVAIIELSRDSNVEKTIKGSAETEAIIDVEWQNTNCFVSCSETGVVCCWDIRKHDPQICLLRDAHGSAHSVSSIAVNSSDDYNLLTGIGEKEGDGKTTPNPDVKLWDTRALGKGCVHTFSPASTTVFDKDVGIPVSKVKWSPHDKSQFAVASADGCVRLWDTKMIGSSFDNSDDELDGPPELLFVHGGHTDFVTDFAWDHSMKKTIISMADDNIMCWRPLLDIFD